MPGDGRAPLQLAATLSAGFVNPAEQHPNSADLASRTGSLKGLTSGSGQPSVAQLSQGPCRWDLGDGSLRCAAPRSRLREDHRSQRRSASPAQTLHFGGGQASTAAGTNRCSDIPAARHSEPVLKSQLQPESEKKNTPKT